MNNPIQVISDFIFVKPEVQKADIILVAGGSVPQLMERAVELHLYGYAPYILPSGGKNPRLKDMGFETEWEYLHHIGISMGVSEEAILKEDKSRNTFENAELSLKVIKEKGIKLERAILVCKSYHSRRALLTYQSVFPKSVEFFVSTIMDRRETTAENWYLDKEKIGLVMSEVTKIGQYFEHLVPEWVDK